MVGVETSAGSRPCDLGRRVSRGQTVEVQVLALLDISYGWLDGDRGRGMVSCTNTNRCTAFKCLLYVLSLVASQEKLVHFFYSRLFMLMQKSIHIQQWEIPVFVL